MVFHKAAMLSSIAKDWGEPHFHKEQIRLDKAMRPTQRHFFLINFLRVPGKISSSQNSNLCYFNLLINVQISYDRNMQEVWATYIRDLRKFI